MFQLARFMVISVRRFDSVELLIYSLLLGLVLAPSAAAQDNRVVQGRAVYEKVEATTSGLDLTDPPVLTAIRNARVEVLDPTTNAVLAVSQTDDFGKFQIPVPAGCACPVRVLSRMRDVNFLVVDNTNANSLYSAAASLGPTDQTVQIIAHDSNRVSGAFNILEIIQQGREVVNDLNPTLVVPDLTVQWSPLNSSAATGVKEGAGSTYFDATTNTISLLGDRSTDSDEFDDSVILHEFGHFVAASFSRDSSPGGVHLLGDELDPRVAWSEGWADFFSSAVRNNPIYIDTYGPNGNHALVYDFRQAVPAGDKPGYWSEFSVVSILWDFFGDPSTDPDSVPQPLQTLWAAFTGLTADYQIYLPYFLENLVTNNPTLASAAVSLAQARSITFNPTQRPSVPNPFPRPFQIGDPVTGTVDSLTTQREDLLQSSDFLTFTAPGGLISIRMDNTGLGPGNDPNSNDLDLFLWTMDGQLVDIGDQGLNGQAQLIVANVPKGQYMVEIRSYYELAETLKTVFNSGTYSLIVRTPTP